MLPNLCEYHRPTDLEEALRLIRRRSVRTVPLAGGTGLLARRDPTVQAVVDLSALGLDYIRKDDKELQIGAMTTLQTLTGSPTVLAFARGVLAQAAHHTATRPLRNVATVGGTIASCGPATDLVVALLALEAAIVAPEGETMALEEYLQRGMLPRSWGMFVSVSMPVERANWPTALMRVARLPTDQAIVNVAAALEITRGVCSTARLAAGGVAARPIRLDVAEQILQGTRLEADDVSHAIATQQEELAPPPSDILGSSEYRREVLGVLVWRAVQRCRVQERTE